MTDRLKTMMLEKTYLIGETELVSLKLALSRAEKIGQETSDLLALLDSLKMDIEDNQDAIVQRLTGGAPE